MAPKNSGTTSWHRMYKASGVQGGDRQLYIEGQEAADDGLEGMPLTVFLAGLTQRARDLFMMGYSARMFTNSMDMQSQSATVDASREPINTSLRIVA